MNSSAVGLVMEYFVRSGAFDNLGTYSMRGLPRPRDDKYADELPLSDPVYAVWGSKKKPLVEHPMTCGEFPNLSTTLIKRDLK